ncbi:hypothetical protein ABZ547_29240 [Streptomyces sparsogenes]|uniref:hypothetical protein n=1 Tax=Streptomyces sparsogenes TaxID=67365 RepID=UPI0033EA5274
MLALPLGRAGHDVIALERWPKPCSLPRAVHFDDEIGRIFQVPAPPHHSLAVGEDVPDDDRLVREEPLLGADGVQHGADRDRCPREVVALVPRRNGAVHGMAGDLARVQGGDLVVEATGHEQQHRDHIARQEGDGHLLSAFDPMLMDLAGHRPAVR